MVYRTAKGCRSSSPPPLLWSYTSERARTPYLSEHSRLHVSSGWLSGLESGLTSRASTGGGDIVAISTMALHAGTQSAAI